MNYNEAQAEADKLCALGYNAYVAIAVFGKTDDEHIYSVQQNGFLPSVKPVVPFVHKASSDDTICIDDIIY
jgi:hypothetical protein